MSLNLTGATRLHIIIGDPIAQVKSPGGMTAAFAATNANAILVPVQVAPEDLGAFLSVADTLKNLDGIVATVPHKFDCRRHCVSVTGRADFIGAVNLMRRRPGGGWHGDMVDGEGFVRAMQSKGVVAVGKRALLAGAGGAGSAVAYALIEAGVAHMAIHDESIERRDALITRITRAGRGTVTAGSPDPTGFDLVCNATPAGMRAGDPLPFDVSRLTASMYAGCVVTAPPVTPFVAAARMVGCVTGTGTEMYQALQQMMVDFLLTPMEAR